MGRYAAFQCVGEPKSAKGPISVKRGRGGKAKKRPFLVWRGLFPVFYTLPEFSTFFIYYDRIIFRPYEKPSYVLSVHSILTPSKRL